MSLCLASPLEGARSEAALHEGTVPIGGGVILQEWGAPVAMESVLRPEHHLVILQTGMAVAAIVLGRPGQSARNYRQGDIDVIACDRQAPIEADFRTNFFCVALPNGVLRDAARELGLEGDGLLTPQQRCRHPRLEHVLRALRAELETQDRDFSADAVELVKILARLLVRRDAGVRKAQPVAQSCLTSQQLHAVTRFIDENLSGELRIRDLAAAIGYSVSHFAAMFRRSTGMSAHHYVMYRRVHRAHALLANNEIKVCDVALEAGFAHQSHLARWMRRFFGTTPRLLHRGARLARTDR